PAVNGLVVYKGGPVSAVWAIYLSTAGALNVYFTTTPTGQFNRASSALPVTDGQGLWMKVTRVQSTGVVTWYTAADALTEPGTWTQLGGTQVLNAGEAIVTSTNAVQLGEGGGGLLNGRMLRFIVR